MSVSEQTPTIHELIATRLWLPIQATATALGLTKHTIYQLCRDEVLEFKRLGARSYITTASIQRMLEQRAEIREAPDKLRRTRKRRRRAAA
jgi:hypothetical protein